MRIEINSPQISALISEVEKQRLDDMFYEGDPLKVSEKEIFNKFIEYVNTNKGMF